MRLHIMMLEWVAAYEDSLQTCDHPLGDITPGLQR